MNTTNGEAFNSHFPICCVVWFPCPLIRLPCPRHLVQLQGFPPFSLAFHFRPLGNLMQLTYRDIALSERGDSLVPALMRGVNDIGTKRKFFSRCLCYHSRGRIDCLPKSQYESKPEKKKRSSSTLERVVPKPHNPTNPAAWGFAFLLPNSFSCSLQNLSNSTL